MPKPQAKVIRIRAKPIQRSKYKLNSFWPKRWKRWSLWLRQSFSLKLKYLYILRFCDVTRSFSPRTRLIYSTIHTAFRLEWDRGVNGIFNSLVRQSSELNARFRSNCRCHIDRRTFLLTSQVKLMVIFRSKSCFHQNVIRMLFKVIVCLLSLPWS